MEKRKTKKEKRRKMGDLTPHMGQPRRSAGVLGGTRALRAISDRVAGRGEEAASVVVLVPEQRTTSRDLARGLGASAAGRRESCRRRGLETATPWGFVPVLK